MKMSNRNGMYENRAEPVIEYYGRNKKIESSKREGRNTSGELFDDKLTV